MAGALADFSRRPPAVRVAVYVAIAVVLGLLYYQVMLGPVRKGVTKAVQDRDDAIAEASALNTKKKKREDLLQTQEELRDKIEQNQKALPTDAEMPAFFDMLARKFNEAGVQVNRREIKKEVSVEDFVKAPVEVEITGSYYQIMQFFASLRPRVDDVATDETSPGVAAADKDRIVTVENLTVYDPRVLNNQLIMTAKFTASTFRTVPVATPPAAAPPPAAAKPPTATPKGAAKPTPGPATPAPPLTPTEAKRATEDAYDKADQRAREAAGADGEPLLPDDPPAAPAKGSGLDRIQGGT